MMNHLEYRIYPRNVFAFLCAMLALLVFLLLDSHLLFAEEPDWCRHLPRQGYTSFKKVEARSDWFEVHEIQPRLYAISEPRQYEEVISYLIVGSQRALLWDSGMGIASMEKVVRELSPVPVIVLNSHT